MILHPATTNTGKFAEFEKSANSAGVQILKLPGIDLMPEPVENATTFMGNAEIKAIAYSKLAPGALVFADDSGLECDDLGGRPGVRSARFADDLNWKPGTGCIDNRNNQCLLALLAELPNPTRNARFVCALALARDGEVLLRAQGEVEGRILEAPRGLNGFGYDPLFMLPAVGQTMAELSREQKWALSHRGKAFRDLLDQVVEGHITEPELARTHA
jgi:XTP/dITP diphosphohydrolase